MFFDDESNKPEIATTFDFESAAQAIVQPDALADGFKTTFWKTGEYSRCKAANEFGSLVRYLPVIAAK